MTENDQLEYGGPERRKTALQLESALAEVQRLNEAATVLATAVTNTAHRSELVALQVEVKREFQIKLLAQVALTIVAVILLIFYMQVKFSHNQKAINKGHDVLSCLLTKTELQRTGDFADPARVACQTRAE